MFAARVEAALKERNAAVDVHHMTNAETEEDGTPLLWMRFHKSLPHDELGQVRTARGRGLGVPMFVVPLMLDHQSCPPPEEGRGGGGVTGTLENSILMCDLGTR